MQLAALALPALLLLLPSARPVHRLLKLFLDYVQLRGCALALHGVVCLHLLIACGHYDFRLALLSLLTLLLRGDLHDLRLPLEAGVIVNEPKIEVSLELEPR